MTLSFWCILVPHISPFSCNYMPLIVWVSAVNRRLSCKNRPSVYFTIGTSLPLNGLVHSSIKGVWMAAWRICSQCSVFHRIWYTGKTWNIRSAVFCQEEIQGRCSRVSDLMLCWSTHSRSDWVWSGRSYFIKDLVRCNGMFLTCVGVLVTVKHS